MRVKFLFKLRKFIVNTSIIVIITLLLFEILYRNSVIDFYRTEVNALNDESTLAKTSVDFLVFGDSFSATGKEINYIEKLRKKNPSLSFMNVSVPGIGIRQVNTFAEDKIEQYQPKAIIYQIYVGNDLIDVDHLWSWEKFSFARNVYWEASDHFLSLSYLNHKATIFSAHVNSRTTTMSTNEFKPAYYDQRTKRFLKYDTSYIQNTVKLKKDFAERYRTWLTHIHTFVERVPKEIPIYMVWIPHCAQVNEYYVDNLCQLGASFENKVSILQQEYPFIVQAKKDLKVYTNVILLNPLSVFQANDTVENRLYFANDTHITNNGNVVLSDFLQSELKLN